MADVTISNLPNGVPSGNGIIPFSLGGNTYSASISGIFQNRPAFLVTTTSVRLRGPGVAPFNYVRYNIGGGVYDTTNYRYTVPVTGLYQISIFTNYTATTTPGGAAAIHLRKNNIQIGTWLYASGASNTWVCLAGTEIHSLNAGDNIHVHNAYDGYLDHSTPETNSWWSSFSGHLIG